MAKNRDLAEAFPGNITRPRSRADSPSGNVQARCQMPAGGGLSQTNPPGSCHMIAACKIASGLSGLAGIVARLIKSADPNWECTYAP
jgi:hypothetical protein